MNSSDCDFNEWPDIEEHTDPHEVLMAAGRILAGMVEAYEKTGCADGLAVDARQLRDELAGWLGIDWGDF